MKHHYQDVEKGPSRPSSRRTVAAEPRHVLRGSTTGVLDPRAIRPRIALAGRFATACYRNSLLGLVLLAVTLLGGCAAMHGTDAAESRIKVDWSDPEAFADVRENPGAGVGRQRAGEWLPLLARHLRSRADSILPPGQHLDVTFTDIKRAGSYEPWRGPQWNDVRVIKEIYPPRIELRFRLTDAGGATLSEGERKLTDPSFLSRGTINNDDPLRYEKRMLDDWLRREFPPAGKAR